MGQVIDPTLVALVNQRQFAALQTPRRNSGNTNYEWGTPGWLDTNNVFAPPVATSGSPTLLTLTGPAHTTLTASTEATDVNLNLARTVQFATGALTTQRAVRILAPTYAFVGASTITNAVTLEISGAPVAGTNATITNPYALRVASGMAFVGAGPPLASLQPYCRFAVEGSDATVWGMSLYNSGGGQCNYYVTNGSGQTWKIGMLGSSDSKLYLGSTDFSILNTAQVGLGVIPTTSQKLLITPTSSSTIGVVVKAAASQSAPLLQLQSSVGGLLGNVGGTIFNSFTDTATTSTDGTENDLYYYTIIANTLAVNGDTTHQIEHAQFVSSATAARRLKKYFAGTLIFDSGSLTLTLGGDFFLETTIIRESSSVVRVSVNVVTTSASSIPYVTYTRITGLTLTGTNVLKTTGIASGAGAASGDIINKMSKVFNRPAA